MNMFGLKKGASLPTRPFAHTDDCKIAEADPRVELPWSEVEGGHWERVCVCGREDFFEPVRPRVRQDPLDPATARHFPACEYATEADPSVLRVLLKVPEGKGPGYSWVTCGACDHSWPVPDFVEEAG
jgi:hypothetical protein